MRVNEQVCACVYALDPFLCVDVSRGVCDISGSLNAIARDGRDNLRYGLGICVIFGEA